MDMDFSMYPGRFVRDSIYRLYYATLRQARLELAPGCEYDSIAGVLRQFIYQNAAPGQLTSSSFGVFDILPASFLGS